MYKNKIWAKHNTECCVSIPPSSIMPLQNDRFPSKHLQNGWFSFFFGWVGFFSNIPLTSENAQKCLGSWGRSCGSFPEKHTQQYDKSITRALINDFETGSMQQSLFCGFVPFNVGSWCILGSLQNDDLEIDIINRFWNCYTAEAPWGHWVLDDGKHNFENHFDENNQEPYPSLFKHLLSGHFVVKRPIHGPYLVDRVSRPPARHFLEKNVGSTKWLVPPPTP